LIATVDTGAEFSPAAIAEFDSEINPDIKKIAFDLKCLTTNVKQMMQWLSQKFDDYPEQDYGG
jgi:hypothetical protein